MSSDSEIAQDGAELDAARKERHASWEKRNTTAMKDSGIAFTAANNGLCLLLREPGKPKVDFYPSTGRWRLVETGRTLGGHAEKLIAWYRWQSK